VHFIVLDNGIGTSGCHTILLKTIGFVDPCSDEEADQKGKSTGDEEYEVDDSKARAWKSYTGRRHDDLC